MIAKEKPAHVAGRPTQNTARYTGSADPLAGWFALANNVKLSRNRQQKRGWHRRRK